jgi:hypothetical protein
VGADKSPSVRRMKPGTDPPWTPVYHLCLVFNQGRELLKTSAEVVSRVEALVEALHSVLAQVNPGPGLCVATRRRVS